ncbi:MAG: glucokinase [Rhodospirillaceae bacterium]
MDLLADIGGTNARVTFRAGQDMSGAVHLRRTADFPSLAALLRDVIAEAGAAPARAALAVAGPVSGDEIRLTNLPWRFSVTGLTVALGVKRMVVENDVAAAAWALTALGPGDISSLTPLITPSSGAKVVVAPGTGLGIAALAPDHRGGWVAVASEGGHAGVALPPGITGQDRDLLHARRDGWGWEDFLSGVGLPRLYHALGGHAAVDTPEAVTARATAEEALAIRAMDIFSRLLGAFAGDVVLMFAGRGGCYLAGGLLGAVGPLFKAELFLAGFRDKDRFSGYMADIPVYFLTHPHPALAGLGVLLDREG